MTSRPTTGQQLGRVGKSLLRRILGVIITIVVVVAAVAIFNALPWFKSQGVPTERAEKYLTALSDGDLATLQSMTDLDLDPLAAGGSQDDYLYDEAVNSAVTERISKVKITKIEASETKRVSRRSSSVVGSLVTFSYKLNGKSEHGELIFKKSGDTWMVSQPPTATLQIAGGDVFASATLNGTADISGVLSYRLLPGVYTVRSGSPDSTTPGPESPLVLPANVDFTLTIT